VEWYYAIEGRQQGPIDEQDLMALAQRGKLKPDDLVWNSAMGEQWGKASSVPGLFSPSGPPAVQPPAASPGPPAGVTPNRDLMAQARRCLRGQWGTAAAMTLVFFVIVGGVGLIPVLGGLAGAFLSGPFMLGMSIFFLALVRSRGASFGMLFDGFKQQAGTAVGAYLLMQTFTVLWSLLLIVPGIIAAIRYSMTLFIIADDPAVGPMEAIQRSKQMMAGHKGKCFCLCLRFVGWMLLGALSLGIGYLWIWPYMRASFAGFYEDIRVRQGA